MEETLNFAKKQTDKIVNYQGANNSYIYALQLLKESGLTGFMDKIPYPCDNTTVNIQLPPESQQQTASQATLSPETKKKGSNLLKIAAMGALLAGTGGLGAAIPIGLSIWEGLNQAQQTSPELPEAIKIDPNFSFEVK
jgi:hypothetical protein